MALGRRSVVQMLKSHTYTHRPVVDNTKIKNKNIPAVHFLVTSRGLQNLYIR